MIALVHYDFGRNASLISTMEATRKAFQTRIVLISPPRTGSTPIARILWNNTALSHHCHEPFEACYWGERSPDSVRRCFENPMHIGNGIKLPLPYITDGTGLLIKEMTFQMMDDDFRTLAALSTHPVVFVVRDPRLSIVSRLKVVAKLSDSTTFPENESGWSTIANQLEICRREEIPYVIVDSDALRRQPKLNSTSLLDRLGLTSTGGDHMWEPRQGLQLCSPDVGILMGEARTQSDPFYERVLSSDGIQPPDDIDFAAYEARIELAGLRSQLSEWRNIYQELQKDPNLIG